MSVFSFLNPFSKKFLSSSMGSIFLLSTATHLLAMPPKAPPREEREGAAAGARRAPTMALTETHPLIASYIGAWVLEDEEGRKRASKAIRDHLKGRRPESNVKTFNEQKDSLLFRDQRKAKANIEARGFSLAQSCEKHIHVIIKDARLAYLSGEVASSLIKGLTSRFIPDEAICLNLGTGFHPDCSEGQLGSHWPKEVRWDLSAFLLSKVNTPDAHYSRGVVLQDLGRYEEAQEAYERSGMPPGFDNIGALYEKGLLGADLPEEWRHTMAYYYYWQAGAHENALENLASLYARGLVHSTWSPAERLQRARCVYQQSGSPAANAAIGLTIRNYCDAYGEDAEIGATYAEARRYLESARTPKALHELGMLYWKRNIEKGLLQRDAFNRAARFFQESNIPSSWNNLGVMYLFGGLGEENSLKNALECWKRADNLPETSYNRAYVYLCKPEALPYTTFKNSTQMQKEAIKMLERLQTGQAFHLLGLAYTQGLAVSRDLKKAKEFLKKAAELGRVEALEDLSDLKEALEEETAERAAEGGEVGQDAAASFASQKKKKKNKKSRAVEEPIAGVEGSVAEGEAATSGGEEPPIDQKFLSGESAAEFSEEERPRAPELRAKIKSLRREEKRKQRAEDPEVMERKRVFLKSATQGKLTSEEQKEYFKRAQPRDDQKLSLVLLPNAKAQMKKLKKEQGRPYYADKLRAILTAIRTHDDSLGRPEVLRGDLAGWMSRHVDGEHRVVYRIVKGQVEIGSVETHYKK